MGTRGPKRLGDLSRAEPIVLSSNLGIAEGLRCLRTAMTLSGQLDFALGRLAVLAVDPLKAFEDAGLPHQLGTYARAPDGTYWPIEVRLSPTEALTAAEKIPGNATGRLSLAAIGKAAAPADSKVGFAAAVIQAIEDLRDRIREAAERGDGEQLRAINLAMATVEAHQALTIEFLEGPNIRTGRTQRVAGSAGGDSKAQSQRPGILRRNAGWQASAEAKWSLEPSRSKLDVATEIFQELPADRKLSIVVIRKAIRRPGHLGST